VAFAAGPVACEGFSVSDTTPVAIEVVKPPDSIHVGDTIPIHVRALNRSGDSIAAVVLLTSLNPDTLGVDTAKTAVIGRAPGPGQIVASTANSLHSSPFRIVVR
jgi:hypothetical protein